MPGIREISGRIRSVEDTRKITNAMYMISSTKLRKARKGMEANAPYFAYLQRMLAAIMESIPDLESTYVDRREDKKGANRTKAILVITADKGLAGSYNHNVLKVVDKLLECEEKVKLYVVGEVGRQYFAGKKVIMAGQFKYTAQNPSLHRARVISEKMLDEFRSGETDEVYIVFTDLTDSTTSEPQVRRLLPLIKEEVKERLEEDTGSAALFREELQFVPNAQTVLENTVPDAIVGYVYSALVDSYCSEQNDRMMAMDNANRNADTMLRSLRISYNRERQAMITQEITEVAAGAKAQKKAKQEKQEDK